MSSLFEKLRALIYPAPKGKAKVAVRVYDDGNFFYRSERNAYIHDEASPYSAANDLTSIQLCMIRRRQKRKGNGGPR